MSEWIQEKSCGAVVYRYVSKKRFYLIEHMEAGHYAHCKGHVEENETEKETAVREIKEETGHDIRFIGDFKESTSYSPYENCIKEVIYFLAECTGGEEKAQLEEVTDILWLSYEDALATLTYDDDKRILKQAEEYLLKKEKETKMSRYDTDYSKMGLSTRAIKLGEGVDPLTKALNTPIYETSTYGYETAEEYDEMLALGAAWTPDIYIYSRTTNPTTNVLEKKVISLEHAEDAVITGCGMAAISTALFANLDAGDHVICSDDTFMCTSSLFADILPAKGIETSRVEVLDVSNVEKAMRPNTKVVYLEALSNPQLKLADLPAIAEIAHKHGCKFIVDNTFLSPIVMRPLEWGADIVVHSGTKYYSGHGDALVGIVAGSKKDIDRIRYYYDNFGSHISPFEAWLTLRSVRTMPLRVRKQSENALALAKWFSEREEVDFVTYPGLESHKQHELAKKMFTEGIFGGMLCVHLKGGHEEMCRFADATRIPPVATSLGDVVTLMFPKTAYNNLIRFSIGCEDVEDLIADFTQAFEAMKQGE